MRPLTQQEQEKARLKFGITDFSRVVVDDNGQLSEVEGDAPAPGTWDTVKRLPGLAVRNAAANVIPFMVGRAFGVGSTALAAPTGPVGMVGAGIAGNVVGGMGASKVQDDVLNAIRRRFPTSAIASFKNALDEDRQLHPYLSMATGGILGAPLGGGGLGVARNAAGKVTPGAVAGNVAIQGGVDAGTQLYTTGEIDPIQSLLATGIGVGTSKPSPSFRAKERSLMSTFKVPDRVIEAYSPLPAMPRTSAVADVEAARTPAAVLPHESAGFNPDYLLSADPAELAGLGDFENAVGRTRTELGKKGLLMTPEELTVLSRSRNLDKDTKAILANRFAEASAGERPVVQEQAAPAQDTQMPMMQFRRQYVKEYFEKNGEFPAHEEVDLAYRQHLEQQSGRSTDARGTVTARPAKETADVIAEQDRATSERLNTANQKNQQELARLQNIKATQEAAENAYPLAGKSAQESAEVIVSRPSETKDAQTALADLKRKESVLKNLKSVLGKSDKNSPEFAALEETVGNVERDVELLRAQTLKGAEGLIVGERTPGLKPTKTRTSTEDTGEEAPTARESADIVDALKTQEGQIRALPDAIAKAQALVPAPVAPKPKPKSPDEIAAERLKLALSVAKTNDPLTAPMRESLGTLQEQLKLMRQGKRPAVLKAAGEDTPVLLEDETITRTAHGVFIHKKSIPSSDILKVANHGRDAIGRFMNGEGAAPVAAATDSVVVEKPSGVRSSEVMVNDATREQAIADANALASKGDKVINESLEQTLSKREEAVNRENEARNNDVVSSVFKGHLLHSDSNVASNARKAMSDVLGETVTKNKHGIDLIKHFDTLSDVDKAKVLEVFAKSDRNVNKEDAVKGLKVGDIVEVNGKEHTVSRISAKGTIGWKGNSKMATTLDKLAADVKAGKARIVSEPPVADQAAFEGFESIISTKEENAMKVVRPARNAMADILGSSEVAGKSSSELAALFKGLSNEDKTRVVKAHMERLGALEKKEGSLKITKKGKEEAPVKSKGIAQVKPGANKKNKQGGFYVDPIAILADKLKGPLERLRKQGNNIAQRFVKKAEELVVVKARLNNVLQDHILKAEEGLTNTQRELIHNYRYGLYDSNGAVKTQLPPELQERAEYIQDIINMTAFDKMRPDSPFIIEYINGKPVPRPFEPKPYYVPQEIKPEIRQKLNEAEAFGKKTGNYTELNSLVQEYVNWVQDKTGVSAKEARGIVDNRLFGPITHGTPNAEFAALRYAEGVGFPPSWRANIFDALKHHVNKHTTDMAYHRTMESDPILGPALGYKENGRGENFVDPVDENGAPVEPRLAGNEDVKAILADYVGDFNTKAQSFEKFDSFIKSLAIQSYSQARDAIALPSVFGEILAPSEQVFIAKALKELTGDYKGSRDKATRAGAVKPGRNISPAAAIDAADGISKLRDIVQTASGAESLNTMQRVYAYTVGKMVARNRIENNDTEFLTKWGPLEWQNKPKEELADYIAARLTQNVVGSYDFQELPSSLLRGSASGWKPFFSLARWSIGRFNRWNRNVWEPAKKGNLTPLISSALGTLISSAGVEALAEMIYRRKPRELTIAEYLKLGGADHANTFFSKAMSVGYAGVLSDIALIAIQGEESRDIASNLYVNTAKSLFTRAAQFMDAVSDGRADIADLGLVVMEVLRDNIQTVRMLSPREDKTGEREENLARRTGFLAESNQKLPPFKPGDPFSAARAYREGDQRRINMITASKLANNEMPDAPSMGQVVRKELSPDQRGLGYYDFIEKAQSPQKADAALTRDVNEFIKRRVMYGKSLATSAQ